MLARIKSMLGLPRMEAATQLKPIAPPKVQKGLKAYPSHLRSTSVDRNSTLPRADRQLATTDIARMSRTQGTREVIRQLAHASPDLSASMFAYLRTAITRRYSAVARNMDGTINPEATAIVQQLLTRFDVMPDYSTGFSGTGSIRSISESFGKELFLYGACASELVLGPDRLPQRIQPLTVTNIEFKPDQDILKPVQVLGGEEIDLDIPTFFYVALDQELMEAYPSSPVESAIKPTFFSEQFMADIQRVVRRAIHPRIKVVIDNESFRKYMPSETQHDEQKAADYWAQMVSQIEEQMNTLEPEDALVYSDVIDVSLESNGNVSLSREYETLEGLTNAKMATGAKIMPAMLGHSSGSSNIASTETLVFMQSAEGAVQFKLNEMYSRLLTLAIRLFGVEGYVEFRYEPINLRPHGELEAFKQMEQSRLLELLSLGLISDEEVSLQLTGHLPPIGYKPLAGTMFRSAAASSVNPYNGATNDGSTMNQNLKSDAPSSARGQNNKSNPVKEGENA